MSDDRSDLTALVDAAPGDYVNGYKRLSHILRASQNGKVLQFWCPGCDDDHQVVIGGPGVKWWWNGSFSSPTFMDSVKVEHLAIEKDAEGRWTGNWVLKDGEPINVICHSYVRDGMIEFLGDCTHAMAGLSAPLELWYTEETQGLPGRPRKG